MSLALSIAKVSEIIPIRHLVLRTGRPIETCHFSGDDLEDTLHFKAEYNKQVVGCVSFMKADNPKFDNIGSYQLRGMAVSPQLRGKNVGARLLAFAEDHLKSLEEDFIWCNVREIAIPFYKKQGYNSIGDICEIETIGPHIVMFKNI